MNTMIKKNKENRKKKEKKQKGREGNKWREKGREKCRS